MPSSKFSVKKKLYFIMGFMAFLGILQIIILWFTISTLSSVRAYVGGEALWSKGQKDALYHLLEYGQNKNESHYQAFLEQIKAPLGDRMSRIELEKENPDFKIAEKGFLQGRNHPEDVPGLIRTFIRFRKVYYIDKSIQIWTKADSYIDSLMRVATDLHSEIKKGSDSEATVQRLIAKLHPINLELTRLEDEFTYTLGEGSRWLSNLVLKLLVGVTLTIAMICLTLIFFVNKSVEKDVHNLTLTTKEIAKGEFAPVKKTYSNQEIGLLANSVDYMSDELKRNIQEREEAQIRLKKAKETAEELLYIQEQFLANTSHEIRTPINGVLGMARQLNDTPLKKDQAEFVQAITESSNNLLRVVNDILDISKIRAGKIVFEKSEFRLADLFKNLQFSLQYRAEEKGIYLKFVIDEHVPDVLIGDMVRLNQVFLNIVGNAIKFTETGGVTVLAKVENTYIGNIVLNFSILDTGIGISEDKLEYIFETFTQAETHTTRKYGGTGLGLNIAKSLVEKQGGKIHVISKTGEGSKFLITMPFEVGDSSWKGKILSPTKEMPANVNLSDVSILLVEDNLINQRIVVFDLQKWKVKVDVADNAEIGLEKLNKNKYDAILMDISMPGMDGLEATRQIRSRFPEPTKSIPIIAMTASAFAGEKGRCFAAGMSDYISKPYNVVTLYSKIVKWTKGEEAFESNCPEDADEKSIEQKINKSLIDLSLLETHSSNDKMHLKEIIEMYIQVMPEYIADLNKFFISQDFEAVRKGAHKMKSLAAYFGITELKESLNEIELVQDGDFTGARINVLLEIINQLSMLSIEELKNANSEKGAA